MDIYREVARAEQSVRRLHVQCCYASTRSSHVELHPGQVALLCSLEEHPGCTQRALAREHNISGASIGMSVKRLEKAGLVIKRGDENDLRSTRLELTEKGRAYAQTAKEQIRRLEENKLRGFSDEELEQYIGFLCRIRDNLMNCIEKGKESDEAGL